MQSKQELRKRYLERRRAMSPEDALVKNRAILERLQGLEQFTSADTVLTYVSSKDNEVDTTKLIDMFLRDGKCVLVPITGPERQMPWSRLHALDELAPSRFGILEPEPHALRLTAPPPDALVIVPGIAFSPQGYRIGYGGGYYDTFMESHKGPKIALAFEVQMLDAVPKEAHDQPVDMVVTEKAVYRGCPG